MATGALVLAVSAIFATKANKKFTNVSTGEARSGTNYAMIIKGSTIFTTAGASLPTVWAQILTTAANHVVAGPYQLFTAVSGHVPILFK